MSGRGTRNEADFDRLREFASIGASWAANALSQVVGRTILTHAPTVSRGIATGEPGEWSTGMFFEADGELSGQIVILLEPATRDQILRILLGAEIYHASPDIIESALRELGNIMASHMVSAIANTLGARTLLSVPSLVMEEAEVKLAARIARRHGQSAGLRIENVLFDREGDLRALLVFAPDAIKPGQETT